MTPALKSATIWFFLTLLAIAAFTAIGPAEKSLGSNVRVVYLHGAWVWSALGSFFAAAAAGAVGLLTRKPNLHRWSRALGRAGLFFWITYLPISLWAMETNWNGLFLAEPRWRMALIFAVGGLLLQVGLALVGDPAWASACNLVFFIVLAGALRSTQQVMHPASPVFSSGSWRIELFFSGLVVLTLMAAWQITRWWHALEWCSIGRDPFQESSH